MGKLIDEPLKSRGINQFVGVLAVGEQGKDALADRLNESFRIPTGHTRLHDERRGQIDKMPNFLRSCSFIRQLLAGGQSCFPLLNESG